MKIKIITDKYFERLNFNRPNRKKKFENRYDKLDFDDITTNIDVPSQSEIDSAVHELDLLDNAAIEGDSVPTVDPGTGIIELDFDDKKPKKKRGRPSKKLKMKGDDGSPAIELDFDDKKPKKKRGRPSKTVDVKSDDSPIRELDFDETGKSTAKSDDKIGVIGKLDYDNDIDTSNLIASIDDVYAGLASPDGEVVCKLVKRYCNNLTDTERLKEIMLTHAIQGNYDSLKVVCGDMRITLSAQEKELGYINKTDVDKFLRKLRKIARSLTGNNNTYGLIPNAIANCKVNDQLNCINVIDFLYEILGLPLQPLYYRGAFLMHCYDVADYILDEIEDIPKSILSGDGGLVKRAISYTDIPANTLKHLVKLIVDNIKSYKAAEIGDLVCLCIKDAACIKMIKSNFDFNSIKGELVLDYLEDSGILTDDQLRSLAS